MNYFKVLLDLYQLKKNEKMSKEKLETKQRKN